MTESAGQPNRSQIIKALETMINSKTPEEAAVAHAIIINAHPDDLAAVQAALANAIQNAH